MGNVTEALLAVSVRLGSDSEVNIGSSRVLKFRVFQRVRYLMEQMPTGVLSQHKSTSNLSQPQALRIQFKSTPQKIFLSTLTCT